MGEHKWVDIMGGYEKLRFFGYFFITKSPKRLFSRGVEKNLKNLKSVEKSAGILGFCTFLEEA